MSLRKESKKINKSLKTQLLESVWPMYFCTKLVGIMALQVRKTKNKELVMVSNNKDIAYFLFYFAFYATASVYTLQIFSNDKSYAILSPLLVFVMAICLILQKFATVISAFIYRKSIIDFFKKIADIDENLLAFGIHMNYKAILKKTFGIMGMLCISSIIRTNIITLIIKMDVIEMISLFSAAFIKSLSKYVLGLLSWIAKQRFRKINVALESYGNRIIPESVLSQDLEVLCRLQFKLCNILRILDRAFSLQMLVSVGITLADVLFFSYLLYATITSKQNLHSATRIICPILWLIDETVELYNLIRDCDDTCEEVVQQISRVAKFCYF